MSDDDFGTINVKRGDRAREIEGLRQHYRQHRDALARMTADAPTDHLAVEYQRLIGEIDRALGKLHELEGSAGAAASMPPPPAPPPVAASPSADAYEPPPLRRTELPMGEEPPRSRVPLIIAAAVLALALIAALSWWASSDRKQGTIVETSETSETSASTAPASTAADTVNETAPPPRAPGALSASPEAHDYGTIRKGTRAVRQFEVTNNSDEPVSIAVARSACRCLYYEHAPVIPPRAKELLTITVDGAKAKAGELRESVKISKKNDPETVATVEVNATIQ